MKYKETTQNLTLDFGFNIVNFLFLQHLEKQEVYQINHLF